MRFRTTAINGLILWTGRSDRSADFLALGLQDGRIEVTYDLGSGETMLRYNTTGLPINDGNWHRMTFTRYVHTYSSIMIKLIALKNIIMRYLFIDCMT